MGLEQLKVREIVRRAVSKNVDIPEFQREFVWDSEQVKLLAESLYRDYPVGSFLLWDSTEYVEARTARGTEASQWIIDGQQRTTALCLLLGMKPFWWPDAKDWNETLDRYDKYNVGAELLSAHLIPESFVNALSDEATAARQWGVSRYQDFLLERALPKKRTHFCGSWASRSRLPFTLPCARCKAA